MAEAPISEPPGRKRLLINMLALLAKLASLLSPTSRGLTESTQAAFGQSPGRDQILNSCLGNAVMRVACGPYETFDTLLVFSSGGPCCGHWLWTRNLEVVELTAYGRSGHRRSEDQRVRCDRKRKFSGEARCIQGIRKHSELICSNKCSGGIFDMRSKPPARRLIAVRRAMKERKTQ